MSLRDVERAMIVFKYFCEKMPDFQQAAKEKPLVQVPDKVYINYRTEILHPNLYCNNYELLVCRLLIMFR